VYVIHNILIASAPRTVAIKIEKGPEKEKIASSNAMSSRNIAIRHEDRIRAGQTIQ
jgi:hypothetical protein